MEFCSKCDRILMPKEKGKHIWLVCPKCGHYNKLKSENDYKIGKDVKREKPEVAIIEGSKKREIKEPKYDIDTDACTQIYEDSY